MPNARLSSRNPISQPEVWQKESESYCREVNKKRTVAPNSRSKCQQGEKQGNQYFRAIKQIDCRVATVAGSDKTLLHDRNVGLVLRHDALESLHHVAQSETCLLKRFPEASRFVPPGVITAEIR